MDLNSGSMGFVKAHDLHDSGASQAVEVIYQEILPPHQVTLFYGSDEPSAIWTLNISLKCKEYSQDRIQSPRVVSGESFLVPGSHFPEMFYHRRGIQRRSVPMKDW